MPRRLRRIKPQVKTPHYRVPPQPDDGRDTARSKSHGRPAVKARRVDDPPTIVDEEYKLTEDVPQTKKVACVVRRRRGKLHQMLEMPLDVMMEICSNLELREVLYLSRLSKAFREVFISRSAQFIWKSAALNTPGLPPCPDDLNIIAYANLMFDASCHNCNCKNCYFVYWGCRVRLCKRCFDQLSIGWRSYSHSLFHHNDDKGKALLVDRCSAIDELIPPLERLDNNAIVHYSHYRPHLEKLVSAWKELPEDDLGAKREEFLKEHQRSTQAIANTSSALKKWFDNKRYNRANELDDIRQTRQVAIIKNLTEEWQAELDYLKTTREYFTRFLKLPEVRKPQALTPRIWNSIKDSIVEYMQKVRKKRLYGIYMGTLRKRVAEVNAAIQKIVVEVGNCHVISYECKLRIPGIFDLVNPEKPEFDLEESLPALRALIQDYLKKRDDNNRKELMVALREELDLNASADPFSLAVGTCFLCNHCDHAFKCQEAIRHVCSRYKECPRIKPDWMSNDYFDIIVSFLPRDSWGYRIDGQLIWSVENFRSSFARVASVVKACGFDVKTATVKDLDNSKNLRLRCLNHKNKEDTKLEYAPIMTWRTAAFHKSRLCCESDPAPTFQRATEKQVLAVKESEKAVELAEALNNYGRYTEYTCAHCSEFLPQEYLECEDHMRKVHNIERPDGKDRVEYDRSEKILPEVYLVPMQRKKQKHALAYIVDDPKSAHLVTFYKFEKW